MVLGKCLLRGCTFLMACLIMVSIPGPASAQESVAPEDPPSTSPSSSASDPVVADPVKPVEQQTLDKRVFGVLPNYRSALTTNVYTPITARQKFVIAAKDSFDYPLILVAAGYGGLGQLTNENPSFGQGFAGYLKRVGTSYTDQAGGNLMTEAVFPVLLHEDPRYFLLGTGSKLHRTGYALTRIFVTRTDSGGRRFNFSEVLGNATIVGISNAYYPDERTLSDNLLRLAQQLGTDAVSQVLKEFWPDVKRRLFRAHEQADESNYR